MSIISHAPKGIFQVLMSNNTFSAFDPEPEELQGHIDFAIDQYYKGRVLRFWVNGEEWLEDTFFDWDGPVSGRVSREDRGIDGRMEP